MNHQERQSGSTPFPDQEYYIDENGRWVFTEVYHLRRGYCCQNRCRHCPYGKKKVSK
uniref:DUF5522 domain-containing protein n=1 Tax=Roseihalotalea indica TaxID=2867963 RepID=A0AA49GMH1_9BACT|nr:DUF5522 domain-containing protein [Tunicatimonas sp. TK19036]